MVPLKFNKLVKIKKKERYLLNKRQILSKSNFSYTLKFCTLYLPSSIKNIRLYSRRSNPKVGNTLNLPSQGPFGKILIKQSYIILVWLRYISSTTSYDKLSNKSLTPSFFIYPCRKYKFTLLKSPMAHKTFSQEQFMYKNYKLSVTFSTHTLNGTRGSSALLLPAVSSSAYLTMFFYRNMPSFSTNMLFLQRGTLRFYCIDPKFFSMFYFSSFFL